MTAREFMQFDNRLKISTTSKPLSREPFKGKFRVPRDMPQTNSGSPSYNITQAFCPISRPRHRDNSLTR